MRRLRSIVQWWRMIHSEDSLPYASVTSIDSGKTLHVDSQVELEVNQITTTIPETLLGNRNRGRNTYTRRSSVVVRVCALVNTSRQTGLDTSTTRVGTITSRKVVPISPVSPVELTFTSISYFNFLCLHCSQAKAARRRLRGRFGSWSCTLMSADLIGLLRRYSDAPLSMSSPLWPCIVRYVWSVRVALGDMRERVLEGSKPGFGRTRR